MEVGKLETTPRGVNAIPYPRGTIFYFILDEDYPDEPRDGHQQYFYVVSETSSYVDAYSYLCHSLCVKGLSAGTHFSGPLSGNGATSSADSVPELDRNSTKLRQWYQLYLKVFGPATFDSFVAQVKAAPVSRISHECSGAENPTALPRLFADERSARLVLEHYRLAKQKEPAGDGGEDGGNRKGREHSQNGRRLPDHGVSGIAAARQQTSCTPEKDATPKNPSFASHRPSTAPGKTQSSATRFQRHQEAQTRKPAPPPPKLSSRAPSLAELQPSSLAAAAPEKVWNQIRNKPVTPFRTAPSASAATPVNPAERRVRGAAGAQTLRQHGEDAVAMTELKQMLEAVRERAESETSRLRQDILDLKRTLVAERDSHDGLLHKAVEKERVSVRAHYDAEKRVEMDNLRVKLKLAEQHVGDLRTALEKEREFAAQQGDQWRKEVQQLHEQIRRQSQEHGERLHAMVKENQVAVDKLDAQSQAKEGELRNLYEDAIQSRDVRIAQLSENLLKSERNAKQSEVDMAELRRRCESLTSELHRQKDHPSASTLHDLQRDRLRPYDDDNAQSLAQLNVQLQRDIAASRAENMHLRGLVYQGGEVGGARETAWAVQYGNLEAAYSQLLQEKKAVERELNRSLEKNAQQQAELTGASHLIQALKDGLETVQNELPILRKEIFLPPQQREV